MSYFSLWLYYSHVVSLLKAEFCYGMKFINLYMSNFETKFGLDNVIWVNTKNYECEF